jgi:hypothetical protein
MGRARAWVFWIAPLEWKRPASDADEATWFGYFDLAAGAGDEWNEAEDDFFWLTRLCRARQGQMGFRWCRDQGLTAPKRAWKNFAQGWAERIGKTQFTCEDSGLFFMPVQIPFDALATGIENDSLQEALQPFAKALDSLLSAKSEFDAMLKDASAPSIPACATLPAVSRIAWAQTYPTGPVPLSRPSRPVARATSPHA